MVSWEFPPQLVGGLGRHVGALVPALRELGHDVRVIIPLQRPALLPDTVLEQVSRAQAGLIEQGMRALTGWRPEVVHGHDWLTGPATSALAAAADAPAVLTMHATETGRQQGYLTTPLQRAIDRAERELCRNSAAVLVCSRFMAGEIERFGVRARVVGNGCAPSRTAAGTRAGRLIVFAGRLVHEKGLQELIKALPLLRAEYPDVRCLILGDGPLREAQQDRARRYGVAQLIEWAGFVDPDRTAELIGRAAVVVVPSLYEPFGLVALEAQAAGTPVAVSDTGGLRELVADGGTGVRFPPENPAAIAAAVARLFDDPAGAAAMADRAQRRARDRFSWTAVAARTAAAYPH